MVLMGFPNALWPTHKNGQIGNALRLLYEHCARTLELGCYLVYLYLFKTQAGSQFTVMDFTLVHWFLFQDDANIVTCFSLQPWDGDAAGELNVEMDSLTKLVGHHGVFFSQTVP